MMGSFYWNHNLLLLMVLRWLELPKLNIWEFGSVHWWWFNIFLPCLQAIKQSILHRIEFGLCCVFFQLERFNNIILPHVIYAVPTWYHFILQKDKEKLMKFLKYTSTIFNLNYTMILQKVNDAARNEFKRMVYKIHNDQNHPLDTALMSLLRK